MKRTLLLGGLLLATVHCSARAPASEPAAPASPAAPATSAAPASSVVAAPAASTEPSASRVVTETFHSAALGVDKAVVVYLPRGYDSQPARRWPVYYYLHGLGGNEANWIKGGKLDATADQLGLGAILVMPDGDDGFYVDSPTKIDYDACQKTGAGLFMPGEPRDTTCVRARNYETYIAKDLVGWVDGHYRTLARRDARAIAGLSMGGFGAMSLGLRHPELFAAAASHSGAISLLYRGPRPYVAGKAELLSNVAGWAKAGGPIAAWIATVLGTDLANWKAHDVVELAQQPAAAKVALYFDCGTEDEFKLHDNLQYVHEVLTARHVEHAYYLGPGHHDFAFWAPRAAESLAFLRDHTAKAQ